MALTHPVSHKQSRILNRDCSYLDLVSKLRRRLRRALFFVGSCHYFNGSYSEDNNLGNSNFCESKLFNQAEKILEAEPILCSGYQTPDINTHSSLLALRIDQLGNRNRQLLKNSLEASRRKCTGKAFDTIDGQIAHLMEQVKQLPY